MIDSAGVIRALIVGTLVLMVVVVVSCGGGDEEDFRASCSISRSELGPFSPDQPLGQTMDEAEARARLAETGFDEWIEIRADGTWNAAWDLATPILGQGIHTDLSWLDVDGQLGDLYADGDSFGFTDLRVSRSFQGKIEHADTPLFIGVDPDRTANFDSECTVTSVTVGEEGNDALLDIFDAAAFPSR